MSAPVLDLMAAALKESLKQNPAASDMATGRGADAVEPGAGAQSSPAREGCNAMTAKPEVHDARVLEDSQTPLSLVLRNEAILAGEDLEKRLARVAKDNKIIRRFIAEQLVEAEYDKKGYPLKGKMHDFYTLPNYDKKCPTKQGGEKLAAFANLRRAKTYTVARACEKDFSMAEVQIELVDKFGQPAGSGDAAATTAESSFQGAAKKYGLRTDDKGKVTQAADWRAAYNDVVARAGKRAFVQAVIYATATDDIFDSTGEVAKQAEAAGVDEESEANRPRFPEKFGNVGGQYLDDQTDETLIKIALWCRKEAKNPRAMAPIAEAIDEILERRRMDTDETGPTV